MSSPVGVPLVRAADPRNALQGLIGFSSPYLLNASLSVKKPVLDGLGGWVPLGCSLCTKLA